MDKQIDAYIECDKSLLIAPAGYGKTTLLANCISKLLSIVSKSKRILILTHTHAGVASIKKKCNEIESKGFVEITTISGFVQKLVGSFNGSLPIPNNDGRPNFNKVNEEAILISKLNIVQKIVSNTYSHFFVDEYQDCSSQQHKILINLTKYIPLHILADPLQAIFRFNKNEGILNFATDFTEFKRFDFLQIPWRWFQDGNNKVLGETIKTLRTSLITSQEIYFSTLSGVKFIELSSIKENFYQELHNLIHSLNSNSLLILYPNGFGYGIEKRAQNRVRFDYAKEFTLIEAIDDKSFYSVALKIDDLLKRETEDNKCYQSILELISSISFNKRDIDLWFNNKWVKCKRDENDKLIATELSSILQSVITTNNVCNISKLLSFLRYELHFTPQRPELFKSIMSILKIHSSETMIERMSNNRNRVRIVGRKVDGKCIGTTLLTKGLEFDDVILIDAHKISNKENFYVAMTRASKRLFVFSESNKWPIINI